MRRALIIALFAALLVASAAQAAATVSPAELGKLLEKDTVRGKEAVAVAGGSIDLPAAMYVRVIGNPKQRILGSYKVICSTEAETKSKQRNFSSRGPVTVRVQIPLPGADYCSIGASAAMLGKAGTLTLKVYGRER